MPQAAETCAASHPSVWKRDALLFDRIYVPRDTPSDPQIIPDELTFGIHERDHQVNKRKDDAQSQEGLGIVGIGAYGHIPDWAFNDIVEKAGEAGGHRAVLDIYGADIRLTPTYAHKWVYFKDFPIGAKIAYEAALLNLPLVDATQTSWHQVIEFRKDSRAKGTYRDLRLWLTHGIEANSVQEATDIIGQKIADYEWAIRKHGLKTFIGTFSCVFDLKQSLATTAVSAAAATIGGPIWAAIASGAMLSGQIAAQIAEQKIELSQIRRDKDREIALLYDAQKSFGK